MKTLVHMHGVMLMRCKVGLTGRASARTVSGLSFQAVHSRPLLKRATATAGWMEKQPSCNKQAGIGELRKAAPQCLVESDHDE